MFNVRLVACWALLAGQAALADGTPAIRSRMELPADFPAGFQIYETVVSREEQLVTLRHANAAALRAARAGRPLPDGSVIVVAQHTLLLDDQGQPQAGAVQSYAAMATRAGWGAAVPPALRNGNWDFALFNARGQRSNGLDQTPCLACHKPLANSSHVFTLATLREHALRAAPP
jgi:Cytochrome P460